MKTIEQLIKQSTTLTAIKCKIDQLATLNEIWKTQVNTELAAHTQVTNFSETCLIVAVENASWGLYLHHALSELLKRMQHFPEWKSLSTIEWYIQPSHLSTTIPSTMTSVHINNYSRKLESAELALLQETAKHVTSEKLKKSLRHLAEGKKMIMTNV